MGDLENPIEATAASTNPDQLPSEDLSMDQLGRQRPKIFKNAFQEVGFCASIFISAILAEFLISGFPVLLPNIIDSLSIDPNKRTWPANVFSLVTGAFLLPCGRLADIHGGYIVFVLGLIWMGIWSIITGFSQNYIMLVFCRALQGIGAAAFLPSGLMLLSCSYRPGPRKNVVFSLYGAAAPVGFFFGILIAGVTAEFLDWAWFFWIGAIMLGIIVVMSWLCIPHHYPKTGVGMDWWGCGTSVLALVLLVYGITDSAHVEGRWRSPQILSTVILGVLVLVAFVYLEGWVVKYPLLPFSLFKPKHMKALMLCLFLCYGSFGIYLFYASFYIETVLHKSPVLTASWFAPLAAGGILIGTFGGLILHRIPGTLLMLLAATGFLVCSLLFAIIPDNPNYWAWIFPAMVCATIGIDIMYNVSNIFITSNVPKSQQGLAGACINTLLFLGMSFCLGFADYGVSQNAHSGLKESYKLGFWIGVGCAAVGVLVILGGIRIGKAKSDLTLEEKEELRGGDAAGREPQVIPSHGNS